LNNPRIIELFAQILQTRRAVRIDIVGVIKGVKKIRRKSEICHLSDFEVLEYRDVCIPRARTDQTGTLARIEEVRGACIETTAVSQGYGQPIGIKGALRIRLSGTVWPERANGPLTSIHRHESC
jgi:hypothetical protein